MSLIIWLDRYDTGITEVDIQHRRLAGFINTLFDAISHKDKNSILNQTLTDLINYTIYHFKLEEDLMQKHHYNEYDAHKWEHKLFVEKINHYIEKIQINDNKSLLAIINYLKDWLLNHIMITDKKYVPAILPSMSK